MALRGVPWFMGGDAEHSPEIARQLAYMACQGNEGVLGPNDLKVVQLDVPGAGVKVLSGGASILSALAEQEAYNVANVGADLDSVKIGNTGSANGRSDLAIVRVDNPYTDDNAQDPDDPEQGPYNKFDVIPGVPAGTRTLKELGLGITGYALARIDQPKSNGTVTNAMITDLRRIANPKVAPRTLVGAAATGGKVLTGTDYSFWPDNSYQVDIPSWATHMIAKLQFVGGQSVGRAIGQLRLVLGSGSNLYPFGEYTYNYPDPGQQTRQTVWVADELKLPDAVKGTTQTLRMQGNRSAASAGNLMTVDSTQYIAEVQFVQRVA